MSTCTPWSSIVLVSFLLIGAFWQTKVNSGPGGIYILVHHGGALQKRRGFGRIVSSTVRVEHAAKKSPLPSIFRRFHQAPQPLKPQPTHTLPPAVAVGVFMYPQAACNFCLLFSRRWYSQYSFSMDIFALGAFLKFKLYEMPHLLRRVDLSSYLPSESNGEFLGLQSRHRGRGNQLLRSIHVR